MSLLSIYYLLALIYVLPRISFVDGERRHFAAFTLSDYGSTTTLGRLASVNEDVYIAYYNSNVGVYDIGNFDVSGFDKCHLVLDNVNPGLSILYLPQHNSYVPIKGSSEATAGSEASWCITLVALFMSGKWRKSGRLGAYTAPLDLFYHRCISLHYQWDVAPTDAYMQLLYDLPPDVTLEDIYLFEKWSRRCPKPLYVNETYMTGQSLICNKIHGKIPLSEPSISTRYCFMNDLLDIDWIPYSKYKKEPPAVVLPGRKPIRHWGYLYAPKAAELSLSLDKSIVDFARLFASSGSDARSRKISEFLESHIGSIRLHYMIGSLSSRGAKRSVEFTFALSFDSDAPVDASTYDFIWRYSNTNSCGSAILGRFDPLMHDPTALIKLEYKKLGGQGQHRTWPISITISTGVLRKMTAPGSLIYVKVVHMLDRTVYVDNDELDRLFHRIESEKLDDIVTSVVKMKDYKTGVAQLRTFRTPYINVEDPESESSPVIFYGYIAVEPSCLTFEKIEIQYTLPLHARYMHMCKKLPRILTTLDVDDRISRIASWDYDISIIAEPQVYVLDSTPFQIDFGTDLHLTEYIAFLRNISLLSRVSVGIRDPNRLISILKPAPPQHRWHRIYFTARPLSTIAVRVSNAERRGVATVTSKFSVIQCSYARCEPIHLKDQHAYVVLTIPVGNHGDFNTIITVTIVVVASAAIGTLYLVYMSAFTKKPKRKIE
ncbi:putative membrane protein [Babesia divergens]|uniref:Membrane protein n=1 Tax=Babesia divergens TaxID=32595 RepID=A0AAD9GFM1_BABDI|nr:putative membrane protein [Babesia divergens]